ncbi:MAG: BatA domain-containing protein, partial [Spirochaetota bacterium]|nr:BatA domain-containing protein [Spirochaetota bacterium]
PTFLLGLFSLLIPIIIHLFNFRKYKKVYFTNVRFLKELKQESESKSKLKNYLILAARLLTLTCIIFAFAQPFLPSKSTHIKKGQKAISLFLDNSFSMEALSKNGMLFENAKNRVREIATAFGDADKFQLLTNDFEGKHQRLVSKEEFLQALDECKISSSFKSLSEIYARQKDLLNSFEATDKRVYIVSDYQKSIDDIALIKEDTTINSFFIPLQSNSTGNVYIDTCWFDSPIQQVGMTQKLHVKITNNSANTLENATIKLYANSKLITPATFDAEPESSTEIQLSFLLKESGIQNCKLEIEDYPVTFDDKIYFSYPIKKNIPCLIINGSEATSGNYFSSLMKNDSLFLYTEFSEKNIEYSKFSSLEFIVLNGIKNISTGLSSEIKKFVNNGGSVFIVPSISADLNSYNAFFVSLGMNTIEKQDTSNTKAAKINYEQGLYEGVFEKKQENIDLPKVYMHYVITNEIKNTQDVILKLINGNSYLTQYTQANGSKIYFCAAPLDDEASNFGHHALFVPTIIRMAINSSIIHPLYYKTGNNQCLTIKEIKTNEENLVHIKGVTTTSDIIPEIKKEPGLINLYTQGQIKEEGNYLLTYANTTIAGVSFNYERKESNMQVLTKNELEEQLTKNNLKNFSVMEVGEQSLTKSIVQTAEGTKLWKLFLILALLFILIEILLIRYIK